jgi:hypothetical protein
MQVLAHQHHSKPLPLLLHLCSNKLKLLLTLSHLLITVLIPRYKGDVEDPKGGVRWVLKNKANYWDDKKNKGFL